MKIRLVAVLMLVISLITLVGCSENTVRDNQTVIVGDSAFSEGAFISYMDENGYPCAYLGATATNDIKNVVTVIEAYPQKHLTVTYMEFKDYQSADEYYTVCKSVANTDGTGMEETGDFVVSFVNKTQNNYYRYLLKGNKVISILCSSNRLFQEAENIYKGLLQ